MEDKIHVPEYNSKYMWMNKEWLYLQRTLLNLLQSYRILLNIYTKSSPWTKSTFLLNWILLPSSPFPKRPTMRLSNPVVSNVWRYSYSSYLCRSVIIVISRSPLVPSDTILTDRNLDTLRCKTFTQTSTLDHPRELLSRIHLELLAEHRRKDRRWGHVERRCGCGRADIDEIHF